MKKASFWFGLWIFLSLCGAAFFLAQDANAQSELPDSRGTTQTFSVSATAPQFFATTPASTTVGGLHLIDNAPILWNPTGQVGVGASFKCNSATAICSNSSYYFENAGGSGMTIYPDGIIAQSGSSHVNLTNTQSNLRSTFKTNTPAGGYAFIVGTSQTDAQDAGTFHTVLMSWGTGISSDATGNVKAAVTGAGLIMGAIDGGAAPVSFSGYGTATLDFASAAAGVCSTDLTITVTGAAAGAPVDLGVPNGSVATGSSFFPWVSAANTVSVRHCCNLGSACDPASGVFSARVWNP